MKKKVILILLLIAVICTFTMTACSAADASDAVYKVKSLGQRDTGYSVQGLLRDAYKETRTIIRKNLTNPSSAEFPVFQKSFVSLNKGNFNYTVSSYFDCLDDSGNSIRVNYTLKLHDDGYGNYTYKFTKYEEEAY